MPKLDIINLEGKKVGDIELSDGVFSAEVNRDLVWEAVRHHQAKHRAGTASTKSRGEVRGGGRKPWRQKGTGRARVGSSRNPLWRGGGIAHGPKPRDYDYHFSKGKRMGALRSVLSNRLADGRLMVIDELKPAELKTKAFVATAQALNMENAIFVDSRDNDTLARVTGNVPSMHVLDHYALNPYDLLRYDKIVFSKAAIESVNERLKK
jgi:large subunit ribosomal protein L4